MALTRLPDDSSAIHRQIDIRLSPTDSLPYMLLGNTGDTRLMQVLRGRARRKGWVLNEYGMAERDTDKVSLRLERSTVVLTRYSMAVSHERLAILR